MIGRSHKASFVLLSMLVATRLTSQPVAAQMPDLSGRWTLNSELSEFPREIGFNTGWVSIEPGAASTTAGARGRRRGSGGGAPGGGIARLESEDDAKRLQQLMAEVRNPPAHLTIVETPTTFTITNDNGQPRSVRIDGREEPLQLDGGVPVGVTAKREVGRLVLLYDVEQGRQLRYTYSRIASPPQVVVDVEFVERGGGDRVRRVYEPATATENVASAAAASVPTSPGGTAAPPARGMPTTGVATKDDRRLNQQPDAELKGISKLGVVVEELTSQAAACGLNQLTLETTLTKRLSDAGFAVRRNSDEDTYLYINVMTTSLPAGLCVSRYDAFLYTHTAAKLSYQEQPVLALVSLLHEGGMSGGTSSSHAAGVARGLEQYVDQFVSRIRAASK